MFRLNRINPQGRWARMNSRSSPVKTRPEIPVMNARELMARLKLPTKSRSRKRPLILLDDALSAGGFQTAAELGGLVGRSERPDHGAVEDTLVAEVSAFDQRCA